MAVPSVARTVRIGARDVTRMGLGTNRLTETTANVEFIRSVRDLEAAETMFFGADAKIVRVVAHYEAQARGD